jgi:hypothetical protein
MRPKRRRFSRVAHPAGLSAEQLGRRVAKRPARPNAVTASELEADVVAFIADRYAGRHLDIEAAQLGLSNAAQRMIVAHLHAVATSNKRKK